MGVKKKVIEKQQMKDEKWITSAPVEVSYTSHGRWKFSTPPQCPECIVTQVDGDRNTLRHQHYWNMPRNADRPCQWVSNELAMAQDEYSWREMPQPTTVMWGRLGNPCLATWCQQNNSLNFFPRHGLMSGQRKQRLLLLPGWRRREGR